MSQDFQKYGHKRTHKSLNSFENGNLQKLY